jgi:RNA-directed DNA polymerase
MASPELPDWLGALERYPATELQRRALQSYGEQLSGNGFPVIFGFQHLAFLLNIEPKDLRRILLSTNTFYRTFEIPKRRGGTRTISAPYPALLEAQRWINRKVLSRVAIHGSAQAFVHGRSILKNAEYHLNRRSLLRVDLKDFFPSITLRRILGVFRWMGYTPTVAYYLGIMCSNEGRLPQGAATSPTLSNIIANRLDKRLSTLSKANELTYSRYADDLIFSGERIPLSTVDFIRQIARDEGFDVNEQKTFLACGNKKKIVTGISVVGPRLKLPRSTRRTLRQELHYVRVNGIKRHIEATAERNPLYVESLLGKFIFWQQVEPENDYVAEGIAFLRGVQKAMDEGNFQALQTPR